MSTVKTAILMSCFAVMAGVAAIAATTGCVGESTAVSNPDREPTVKRTVVVVTADGTLEVGTGWITVEEQRAQLTGAGPCAEASIRLWTGPDLTGDEVCVLGRPASVPLAAPVKSYRVGAHGGRFVTRTGVETVETGFGAGEQVRVAPAAVEQARVLALD